MRAGDGSTITPRNQTTVEILLMQESREKAGNEAVARAGRIHHLCLPTAYSNFTVTTVSDCTGTAACDDGVESTCGEIGCQQLCCTCGVLPRRPEGDCQPMGFKVCWIIVDAEILRYADTPLREVTTQRSPVIEPTDMHVIHCFENCQIASRWGISRAGAKIFVDYYPIA